MLVSGLQDTGACGLYSTGGWQSAWLPLFRRAGRVYVAPDRDATDRAITLARTFAGRGRVLIPPEDLGPKDPLSPASIVRLKAQWVAEYEAWQRRPLEPRYAYCWADGIYLKAGPGHEKTTVLIVIGVTADGRKESVLERALAMSPTPWALQIERLPQDLAPWDLEDHAGVRHLLCELGHQGPLSRDAHLRLLAERYGVELTSLQEAARELAQSADAEA